MFGTIAHLRVKQGKEQDVIATLEEWDRTRRPHVKGSIGGCVYRTEHDSNHLVLVVMFQDRASYFANANDPEQDRWYQKLRGLLSEDPKWEDGEILGAWGAFGSLEGKERKLGS